MVPNHSFLWLPQYACLDHPTTLKQSDGALAFLSPLPSIFKEHWSLQPPPAVLRVRRLYHTLYLFVKPFR